MSTKCPICLKNFLNKAEILQHAEKMHKEEVEKSGMSAAQYIYSLNHNGRTSGICRYCGKETPWNEQAGKPYQICGSESCKAKNAQIAKDRMMNKYGKTCLLNDPEQQAKMLANRRISGIYKWSDGKHEFTYTGTYELEAIRWLDKVMEMDPETIQMPGPALKYEYEGATHTWLPDMYLTEFNLIIEVKDGGENKHPGFEENRKKEKAKDAMMGNQSEFNYLKLTHKNMMQLVKALNDIRAANVMSSEEKVIEINESNIVSTVSVLTEGKIEFVNDKGEKVPKICPKCGSKVGVFLRGEPVFACSNKDCNKYFGTVPCKNESINEEVVKTHLTDDNKEKDYDMKNKNPRGKQRFVTENGHKVIKLLPGEKNKKSDEFENMIAKDSSNTYLISDLHFEPTEESKICFLNFIKECKKKLNKDSVLLLLGDITMRNSDEEWIKTFLKLLLRNIPTKNVILVLGNHDDLTVDDYYKCGFAYVTNKIVASEPEMHFTHAPEPVAGEVINFHGHNHESEYMINIRPENHINVYAYGNENNKSKVRLLSMDEYLKLYSEGYFKYIKYKEELK